MVSLLSRVVAIGVEHTPIKWMIRVEKQSEPLASKAERIKRVIARSDRFYFVS